MAVQFSATSALWSSSSWKTVDATSYLNSEAANTATTVSYAASSTFTPGAITVEGMLLKIKYLGSLSGTFSVQLYNSTGAVAVATVTCNVSDIYSAAYNTDGGWCYFKFGSPVTLLAATAYSIRALSSVAGSVVIYSNGTTNWSRGLVTSTTTAIAASDTAIICGNISGTGSTAVNTITFDYTGADSYALLEVGAYGKLVCENSASKNYALTINSGGAIRIAMGGIIEIGNSSTRIDASSTFIITLTAVSSGITVIDVRNGVFRMYGASKTRKALLAADASIGATTLTTNISTGWKNGDNIGIAGTGGITQQMFATLNADAVGTSLSLSAGLTYATEGTSPVQADVINLTSNVKIQGTSTTLTSYTIAKIISTYDVNQVEYRYMASGTATPSILVQTNGSFGSVSLGSLNVKDCAFHSASTVANTRHITDNTGLYSGVIIDGCVFYHTTMTAAHLIFYNCMPWAGQSYLRNCVAMGGTSGFGVNSHQYVTLDSDTFANINGVATSGYGYQVAVIGTTNPSPVSGTNFNNIKSYRCVNGFQIVTANIGYIFCNSTISNCTFFRNTYGINCAGYGVRLLFDSCLLFGNTSGNIYYQALSDTQFINCSFQGGTGTVAPYGLNAQGASYGVVFNNCNFGTVTQHSTADIYISNPTADVTLNNCNFGSTTIVGNQRQYLDPYGARIQRLNGNAGSHRVYKSLGTLFSDTTIFDTSPSSQRLAPAAFSYRLKSTTFQVPVASGQTATISVRVRKSVVGDGTAYNGSQPRLVLKCNPSAGSTYNSDIVCQTASAAAGTWETLSYTLPVAVADNVAMEFYVDCDGTTGWVNVDTIVSGSTNNLTNYLNGEPLALTPTNEKSYTFVS